MNTIPEGKELIWTEAVYKEPIEGIPFSNVGITMGISKYIEENDRADVLGETVEKLVKKYFDKLSKEIRSTRNDLIDKVRKEVAEEYGEKFEKAKSEVLRLYKLCEDNNINYKEGQNDSSN